MNTLRNTSKGFSLLEVLLSLLILAGSVLGIMKGLDIAQAMDAHSRFEHLAAVFGERELELLKTDLLRGTLAAGPASMTGRIKLPPGWAAKLVWTPNASESTIRLKATVINGETNVQFSSFLYVPGH